jgi:hypothetical protein
MKTIQKTDELDIEKIEMIKKIAHPNIIKYYDNFTIPSVSFQLIIEYCEVYNLN